MASRIFNILRGTLKSVKIQQSFISRPPLLDLNFERRFFFSTSSWAERNCSSAGGDAFFSISSSGSRQRLNSIEHTSNVFCLQMSRRVGSIASSATHNIAGIYGKLLSGLSSSISWNVPEPWQRKSASRPSSPSSKAVWSIMVCVRCNS